MIKGLCTCEVPDKEYSKEGCHACWICKHCGNFGGCDNAQAVDWGESVLKLRLGSKEEGTMLEKAKRKLSPYYERQAKAALAGHETRKQELLDQLAKAEDPDERRQIGEELAALPTFVTLM